MVYKNVIQTLQQVLVQESLLNRIVNRIRQSLDLQEILTTTVLEVRSFFLGIERVKIYRFAPDGSGEVIAESIHGITYLSVRSPFSGWRHSPMPVRCLSSQPVNG